MGHWLLVNVLMEGAKLGTLAAMETYVAHNKLHQEEDTLDMGV